MADEGNKPSGAESPEQVVVNGTSEDDKEKYRPADIDAVSRDKIFKAPVRGFS